jgi:hypothetical protein
MSKSFHIILWSMVIYSELSLFKLILFHLLLLKSFITFQDVKLKKFILFYYNLFMYYCYDNLVQMLLRFFLFFNHIPQKFQNFYLFFFLSKFSQIILKSWFYLKISIKHFFGLQNIHLLNLNNQLNNSEPIETPWYVSKLAISIDSEFISSWFNPLKFNIGDPLSYCLYSSSICFQRYRISLFIMFQVIWLIYFLS